MDKENDIKKYIKWILIGVIAIVLYIVIALSVNNSSKATSDDYLLVGNKLIWNKIDGVWYQVTEVNDDLLKHKYTLDDGQNTYQIADIQYSDLQWYFFDENYKEISSDGFRVAYSGDLKIKTADYNEEKYDESDDDVISAVVSDISVSQLNIMRASLLKYSVDLDNDGQNEVIYTFSDNKLDVLDYIPTSYLVLVKNGEVLDQIKTTGSSTMYVVQEILDLDNDGAYELVVSSDVIDNPTFDSCYQIYKIVSGKIKLYQQCLYEK